MNAPAWVTLAAGVIASKMRCGDRPEAGATGSAARPFDDRAKGRLR